MKDETSEFFSGFIALSLLILCFSAWVTHIVFCLSHGRWGFLIAGALAFPIAIVHGFLIWLGVVS